jgi:hypothetical protein
MMMGIIKVDPKKNVYHSTLVIDATLLSKGITTYTFKSYTMWSANNFYI